ncbi:MAG: HAD-IA family hydrolase [candidate division WOR-3 bacterium]
MPRTGARYSVLLFDLDGTLVDSAAGVVKAVRHAFEAIGQRVPDEQNIVANIGRPLRDFPARLGYDLDEERRQEFVSRYRAFYSAHCTEDTTVFPGVRTGLGRLRESGLRLAVVTTKIQEQAEKVTQALGLVQYFESISGWSDGQKMKPDPEPILRTLDRLGTRPDQALMIGDSEQDILAARAARVDSCACLYGYRAPSVLLELCPNWTIRRFPELLRLVLL